MLPQQQARAVVLGLARNCAATLATEVGHLRAALAGFATLHWFVVESDSDDDTISVLQSLAAADPAFSFSALGRLRDALPLRTQRIAHCRNAGLARLRTDAQLSQADYVVVADLDGVNAQLTRAAVATCWQRSDWAACMANQDGPYYDVWALRHPVWCAQDCWEQARFLAAHGQDEQLANMAAVFSRMVRIAHDAPWLEVDSAFGGLAIYRADALRECQYTGVDAQGAQVCEHVTFHAALRASGARLFINPALINSTSDHLAQHWPARAQIATATRSWMFRLLLHVYFGRDVSRQLRKLLRGLA